MGTTGAQIDEAVGPDGLQHNTQHALTKENLELCSQQSAAALGLEDDSKNGLSIAYKSEFVKSLKTREEKLLGSIVLTLLDGKDTWEGSSVEVDSGSLNSLIHPDIVRFHELKPRPLLEKDCFTVSSPLDQDRKVEVKFYVEMKVKCRKIGLETVDMCLGIAPGAWEILMGRKFMNKHKIWRGISDLLLENEKRGEVLRALRNSASKASEKPDRIAREEQREEALEGAMNVEPSISSRRSFTSSNSDWGRQASSVSSQQSSEITHQITSKARKDSDDASEENQPETVLRLGRNADPSVFPSTLKKANYKINPHTLSKTSATSSFSTSTMPTTSTASIKSATSEKADDVAGDKQQETASQQASNVDLHTSSATSENTDDVTREKQPEAAPNYDDDIQLESSSIKLTMQKFRRFCYTKLITSGYKAALQLMITAAEKSGLYERALRKGFIRLKWNCICGDEFFQDYPDSRLVEAQSQHRMLLQSGYHARIFAQDDWIIESPESSYPNTSQRSTDFGDLPTDTLSSIHPDSGSKDNTAGSGFSSDLGGELAQRGLNRHEVKDPCPERSNSWLTLIFPHNRDKRAVHIEVENNMDDVELIRRIKEEYIKIRGNLYYFTWETVTAIKFVRFTLWEGPGDKDIANIQEDQWAAPKDFPDKGCWKPFPEDPRPEFSPKWAKHLWEKSHHSPTYLAFKRWLRMAKVRGSESPNSDTEAGGRPHLAQGPTEDEPRRRFLMEKTPRLHREEKLKSDYNEPTLGWGLYLHVEIVEPMFLIGFFYLLFYLLIPIMVAVVIINLARERGYAALPVGTFSLAIASAISPIIFKFLG